MITSTFCHIPGISLTTEKKLLQSGISNWDEFLENYDSITCLSQHQLKKIKQELEFSRQAYEEKNIVYFLEKVPPKLHWKLHSFGSIAYVDIETTGLSRYTDKITTIGIYDGKNPKVYIRGKNLDEAYQDLQNYNVLVTFNGKQFDLPFIEQQGGIKLKDTVVHLDLRFLLKELGLAGGLKKIELALGISRPEELEGVDGFEAVRLWRRYEKQGDIAALEKLVKYNIEDIVNLKFLLQYYLDQKTNS